MTGWGYFRSRDQECLSEEVTFEQKPGGSEGAGQGAEGNSILGRGTAGAKALRCLRNSQEDYMMEQRSRRSEVG